MKTNSIKGIILLILAQAMVAVNIVYTKELLDSIPPVLLLAVRFFISTVSLTFLHYLSSAKKHSLRHYLQPLSKRDWMFIFGQAVTAGVLFNFFMLIGLQYTDANAAGIITSALPAIIAIMSWIILGEKISPKKSLCILFATLGLIIIAFDKFNILKSGHSFLGDFLVFLSLFPEASYYILTKIYPTRLPIFLISALLNGINAILICLSLPFFDMTINTINLYGWIIAVCLGLSTGLFYIFWNFGAKYVDGVMASLLTAVMPVVTVVLAWIILGEQLSLGQLIGMCLVILSIVIYARIE